MSVGEGKPCRACGERPRAPGKLRCRKCLDAAKAKPDLLADLQESLERPEGKVTLSVGGEVVREEITELVPDEDAPFTQMRDSRDLPVYSAPPTIAESLEHPLRAGDLERVITSTPDEMQRLLDRIDELEAEVELLRNPLSAAERWRIEKAEILDKLADRAKAGDVQAIKAWSELRKLEAMEAETTGQTSIDDLVVPAGTRVDSTPTKEKP